MIWAPRIKYIYIFNDPKWRNPIGLALNIYIFNDLKSLNIYIFNSERIKYRGFLKYNTGAYTKRTPNHRLFPIRLDFGRLLLETAPLGHGGAVGLNATNRCPGFLNSDSRPHSTQNT